MADAPDGLKQALADSVSFLVLSLGSVDGFCPVRLST